MAMTNMQMSKEEAKEYSSPVPGDAPRYPYGLCLCLDDDALAKLGIATPLPVGTEVMITARAKVTGTRSNEDMSGEAETSMDLQVTDMEIATGARSDGDIAKSMYPGMA